MNEYLKSTCVICCTGSAGRGRGGMEVRRKEAPAVKETHRTDQTLITVFISLSEMSPLSSLIPISFPA